jgi:hypothetical protein
MLDICCCLNASTTLNHKPIISSRGVSTLHNPETLIIKKPEMNTANPAPNTSPPTTNAKILEHFQKPTRNPYKSKFSFTAHN